MILRERDYYSDMEEMEDTDPKYIFLAVQPNSTIPKTVNMRSSKQEMSDSDIDTRSIHI